LFCDIIASTVCLCKLQSAQLHFAEEFEGNIQGKIAVWFKNGRSQGEKEMVSFYFFAFSGDQEVKKNYSSSNFWLI